MPYGKYRKTYRKKRYHKHATHWGWKAAGALLPAALTAAKYAFNTERKFADFYASGTIIANPTVVQWVSNSNGATVHDVSPWAVSAEYPLSQGVGSNQRLGNSIKITELHMKFNIAGNASNTNGDMVRLMVFIDMRPSIANDSTTAPVPADLIENYNSTLANDGTDQNLLGYRNMNNAGKRFHVVYDKVIILDPDAYDTKLVQIHFKRPFHMEWDTTDAGAQANVGPGHIYYYICNTYAATNASHSPAYTAQFRLRYVDN